MSIDLLPAENIAVDGRGAMNVAARDARVEIRDARLDDLDALADIHAAAFPGFFLTRLGRPFLKAYYETVLENGIVLVGERDGRVRGFVSGFLAPATFSRKMKERKARFLLPLAAAFVRRPWLLLTIVRSVFRVGREAADGDGESPRLCELSSIAVAPLTQGRGVGRRLAEAFLERARERGAARVRLTTRARDNGRTRRFHESVGFQATRSFEQSSGRTMVEYVLPLRDDGEPISEAPRVDIARRPLKRAADIALSALGIALLSPVMLVAALLVKLSSPGPIIFRQERMGRGFRSFRILKFRSMVQEAGRLGGPVTFGDDKRITRIGRLLRATKLDELPQLFNILRGDMSFVGPRPECRKYVEMFLEDYAEVLSMRPGLTDPASIKYRDEAALLGRADDPEATYRECVLPDKIAMAKAYIREQSFWSDFKIILRTFMTLVADRVPALRSQQRD